MRLIDQLGVPPSAITDLYAFPMQLTPGPVVQMCIPDLREAQEWNPDIKVARRGVMTGSWPIESKSEHSNVSLLQRESHRLLMTNRVLYRKVLRPTSWAHFTACTTRKIQAHGITVTS